MFEIDICNSQRLLPVDESDLQHTLEAALRAEGVTSAVLSVSIVDNTAIHVINRKHLQHDYPTDVISFQLDFSPAQDSDATIADQETDRSPDQQTSSAAGESRCSVNASRCELIDGKFPQSDIAIRRRAAGASIEGEIVASAEMAMEMAEVGKWTALSELKLYLIHGMLHICGYDDLTPDEQQVMRFREREIMAGLGLTAIYAEEVPHSVPTLLADRPLNNPDREPDEKVSGRTVR